MISKKSEKELEEYFKINAKGYVTYEKLVKFLSKVPGVNVAKKIEALCKKYEVTICSSAEIAKMKNLAEAKAREKEKKKLQDISSEKEFDLADNELLEWGRSDSPVRMYLREMGQISLLNKDEEIEISRKIELGEDIIIDAFCSVPYLIDFILDYREPLINRERRVKELFKSFDDEEKSEDKLENLEDELANDEYEELEGELLDDENDEGRKKKAKKAHKQKR